MCKRTIMGFLCIVLVLVGSEMGYARVLDQSKVELRIEVPIMQQLRVIEPILVTISPGQDRSTHYSSVGKVEVRSNSNWTLTVDAIYDPSLQVEIRPSHDQSIDFKPVDGVNSVFFGPSGFSEMAWDVRVRALETAVYEQTEHINFVFTLESI